MPFTSKLAFVGGLFGGPPIPAYRAVDERGADVPGAAVPHALGEATAVKMYRTMVTLQARCVPHCGVPTGAQGRWERDGSARPPLPLPLLALTCSLAWPHTALHPCRRWMPSSTRRNAR